MSQLTPHQIEEIIILHNKGLSQRGIAQLKGHSRKTISKYIQKYYDDRFKKMIEEHNKNNPIEVYAFSVYGLLTIAIIILLLAGLGIYHLITL